MATPPSPPESLTSPSDELAKIICEKLKQAGLLTQQDMQRFSEKMATGKTKPEDWRLAVEKAMDSKESI
ncbi:hypothetical protein VSS37_19805 [Candidatus Thiothrix sp. Deng01]|uniref:Uncharacterized protein n=1 Tax=Candidatus Thiothrix phosphatis TaxID=3112415 RepID=A0ABU6D2F4_9GAMM|nr:hypothetical protein [Candidatus Thiothrix sp. Deng01]MEB4593232.1 hypothetical protein [Candidatus Thiothrix sp. Deng01]